MKIDSVISSREIALRTLTSEDCNEENLWWMCNANINKYLEVRRSPSTTVSELRAYVETMSYCWDIL